MGGDAKQMSSISKKRLAIMVNVVAPYRLPIYQYLGEVFDLKVFSGKRENNRSWTLPVDSKVHIEEAWGWVFPVSTKTGIDGVRDTHYVHINPGLLLKLWRFKPDVVVSNEMGFRSLVALLYGFIFRVPVWIWWGGTLHSERNASRLTRFVRHQIVRHAKHWISYGKEASEYLRSLGVKDKCILQIQNCVEQEKFTQIPASKSGLLEGLQGPVLLCVGQLLERKGLSQLIESCARLAKQGLKFSLVLVGNGPERNALVKLAEDQGFQGLLILPNQNQERINQLYHEADLFVFPTLEDIWGLVVNEALWAGMPVVCSRYAGCAVELIPEERVFDPLVPDSIDVVIKNNLDKIDHAALQPNVETWQNVSLKIASAIEV